ncbi:MAG TPA: sigma-70 family RNA polymerase sigma factor [Thermoanaerobaculia bacterium]|nr:sigma-70 family RNA polymerase sigma factor [Thermoanaerobaculia bacterium]
MSLASIVERARDDRASLDQQHAAFAELVRRFEEAAFGWSLRSLGDPAEAKDAAQDAFLTAWLKLRQLHEPAAFATWLKRLVMTQCNRRRRKARTPEVRSEASAAFEEHRDTQRLLASAMAHLSESDSRIVTLFYFLGRTLDEIARILGIARGTVGKRLHVARIAMRRHLPRAVRDDIRRLQPASHFVKKIREGVFDEYVGEYHFDKRPDLVVRIAREDDLLVGYGGGQRTVLASIDDATLVSTAFDGEGRFRRGRSGRVTQFIYYEFGARLGIATKQHRKRRDTVVPACSTSDPSARRPSTSTSASSSSSSSSSRTGTTRRSRSSTR